MTLETCILVLLCKEVTVWFLLLIIWSLWALVSSYVKCKETLQPWPFPTPSGPPPGHKMCAATGHGWLLQLSRMFLLALKPDLSCKQASTSSMPPKQYQHWGGKIGGEKGGSSSPSTPTCMTFVLMLPHIRRKTKMRGNFILDWGQTLFFIIYLLWAGLPW